MGNQASWQNRGLHIFLSAASVKKIVWIHKQKLCVSVMDDPRIEWIRDRVYNALDIKENEVFEELLEREDGEFERNLGKFLNDSPEEGESSILFYKIVKEEEEEVEVECEPEIPDIEEEEEAAPEGEEGAEKEPEEDEPQALPTSEAEPEEEAEAKSAKKSKGKKKGKGKKGAEEEEEPPKQE